MVWNDGRMLYDMTNGRWKLPVGSGHIKRPHGSIIFTLNLVKPTLQIGNQPGSSFVTMSQINKFHSHKFSYILETLRLKPGTVLFSHFSTDPLHRGPKSKTIPYSVDLHINTCSWPTVSSMFIVIGFFRIFNLIILSVGLWVIPQAIALLKMVY